MESVKKWAESKNYDYLFIDDALFNYVPEWFKEHVHGMKLPQTDYARLLVAREKLESDYDCVIWMDADILIFDPENFHLNIDVDYAMCKEIWFDVNKFNQLKCSSKINNAVMVFTKTNHFLDFYIDACEKMVKTKHHWVERLSESNVFKYRLSKIRYHYKGYKIENTTIGPRFITDLYKLYHYHTINNVGIISPMLMKGLYKRKDKYPQFYMKMTGNEIFAANLCGSFYQTTYHKFELNNHIYSTITEILLNSRGKVLNKYLKIKH